MSELELYKSWVKHHQATIHRLLAAIDKMKAEARSMSKVKKYADNSRASIGEN